MVLESLVHISADRNTYNQQCRDEPCPFADPAFCMRGFRVLFKYNRHARSRLPLGDGIVDFGSLNHRTDVAVSDASNSFNVFVWLLLIVQRFSNFADALCQVLFVNVMPIPKSA